MPGGLHTQLTNPGALAFSTCFLDYRKLTGTIGGQNMCMNMFLKLDVGWTEPERFQFGIMISFFS